MPRHLVSYFGNRYLDHFARDLEEIVDHGFNGIVHCATEADLQWGIERLGEVFAMTRDAGLECWADPWGVAGVFGGEAHSGFRAFNPDASLDSPQLLGFLREWTDAMAGAGAETIFWDEPHGEGVLPFLEQVSSYAAEKGLRNSVCLYPFEGNQLEEVARLPGVNDVGVDPYPVFQMHRPLSEFDADVFVGGWAKRLLELHGVSVHIWIQGFAIPEGFEHLVPDCAEAARRAGVHDLGFWGYRAAEVTSAIRPADPARVWELARSTFRLP